MAQAHRPDRFGVLSPLEESSAEVSRDSGIVSLSASSLSMVSEALSSGTVSQSPSFGAVVSQSPSFNSGEPALECVDEEILRHTAQNYSAYIRASASDEVSRVNECLLTRCFSVRVRTANRQP